MYKLKSNEEITKGFDIEYNEKFDLLQKKIIETTISLREMQREHKFLTGKIMTIL